MGSQEGFCTFFPRTGRKHLIRSNGSLFEKKVSCSPCRLAIDRVESSATVCCQLRILWRTSAEEVEMRVIMGSDHRGRDLCHNIWEYLSEDVRFCVEYVELDDECVDYPDIAADVASAISYGRADYGILICGTGIGMTIVANKFPGVRAAPCHSVLAAEFCRRFTDANVLCLSGDMLGERSSRQIVDKWLSTSFDGGRHATRLDKIRAFPIEAGCRFEPKKFGQGLHGY